MQRVRRAALAVAITVTSIGAGGAALLATATPSGAALPACTDNWQGPTTGTTSWSASAANWSSGFPTGSSVVCITAAGTYTVALTSGVSVDSFQIGGTSGTQTVAVEGSGTNVNLQPGSTNSSQVNAHGVVSLEPGAGGWAEINNTSSTVTVASGGSLTTSDFNATTNPAYVEANLTIQSGGSATIGATTTQDFGTTTTNDGTFTVSSGGSYNVIGGNATFTDAAGTLANSGAFNETAGTFTQSGATESGTAIQLGNVNFDDSAGTGTFDVVGSSNLTGSIPAGQTVVVEGKTTNVNLNPQGSVTVAGVLAVEPGTGGWAEFNDTTSTVTVASGGSLTTSDFNATTNPAYVESNLVVQAGGHATIGAITTQDYGTTTTNSGTFTVSSGGSYNVIGGNATFTDAAGTLANSGAFNETAGTFTQSGATESGTAIQLGNVNFDDSAGTGTFDVVGSSNLTGAIPSGQTVVVEGKTTNVNLNPQGSVTVAGVLAVEPGTGGWAEFNNTNSTVTIASGGNLTTSDFTTTTNPAYVESNLTIQSGGSATIGAITTQDYGTTTTNSGTFTVSSGGSYNVIGGNATFTDAAGTLANSGAFNETAGTFTQSGATESGTAIQLGNVNFDDSAGTGTFDVVSSSNLTGTIPSGQTVVVQSSATNVNLNPQGTATVDGTLSLEPGTGGWATFNDTSSTVTIASGGKLTTSDFNTTTNHAYVESNLVVQPGGQVNIGATTTQDYGTTTTDDGTFTVANGGSYAVTAGNGLLTGDGTFVVTVNGTGGGGGISGSRVDPSNGSTLSVATVGTVTAGTSFTPITGPVEAKFSTVAGGAPAYDVSYPSSAVQVTAETTTFGLSATSFGAPLGTPTGAVAVAALSSVKGLTGSYTATVDYGDGTGPQAATVVVKGTKGTVTGPTHTYSVAGEYHVTIAVTNSVTGTQVVGEQVAVTGLSITSLSKTTVAAGKKLSTTVYGTGFDASAGSPSAWTTDNPGVTVLSAKVKKATKKQPNPSVKLKLSVAVGATAGPVKLTLTQDTGSTSLAGAFTITG